MSDFSSKLKRRIKGTLSRYGMRQKELPYWETRKNDSYYKVVLAMARAHVPKGGSHIDIGAGHNVQYQTWFDWFEEKHALDMRTCPNIPGVQGIHANFMDYQITRRFSLVTCLQVLEHLSLNPCNGELPISPKSFAQKLLELGEIIIISVPYQWPEEACKHHYQDPIDEEKVHSWLLREPIDSVIDRAGRRQRLIQVYEGI